MFLSVGNVYKFTILTTEDFSNETPIIYKKGLLISEDLNCYKFKEFIKDSYFYLSKTGGVMFLEHPNESFGNSIEITPLIKCDGCWNESGFQPAQNDYNCLTWSIENSPSGD
tara:strand:+ start:137 stop:472 length:336 start_codon:yes stop_codon:yes gene_type:complete